MLHSPSGGKTWCGQCERNVSLAEGAACTKAFCKAPKPSEEAKIGFPPQAPKPDLVAPKAVDADPSLIRRIERERRKAAPEPDPEPDPEPEESVTDKPDRRPGLTRKQTKLLDHLESIAVDGLVKVSYSDVAEPIGSKKESVLLLFRSLEREGYVTIVDRPGGRAKTTYRLLKQDEPPPPTKKLEDLMTSEDQPWEAVAEPVTAAQQRCGNCRFSRAITIGHMVCRRLPPAHTVGHPKIKADDWCGEWRLK